MKRWSFVRAASIWELAIIKLHIEKWNKSRLRKKNVEDAERERERLYLPIDCHCICDSNAGVQCFSRYFIEDSMKKANFALFFLPLN